MVDLPLKNCNINMCVKHGTDQKNLNIEVRLEKCL